MTYDRKSYGERSRDRLGEEAVGGEIEEEPSDLDQPEGLFEEDDLEDSDLEIEGEELDDDSAESDEDEDDEERASPLAKDAPPKRAREKGSAGRPTAKEIEEEEPGYELAAALEDEEDIDDAPGVRTSGATDISAMNESDRRREFPRVSRESRGPVKRKESGRGRARGRRGRRKPVRA